MTKKTDNVEQVKSQPEEVKTIKEADVIWAEIKDKKLSMFSLQYAKVSDFCKPVSVAPNKCFIITKASAVLPALEEALGAKYSFEVMNKYIVVSRKTL